MKVVRSAVLISVAAVGAASGQGGCASFEIASVKQNTTDEFPDFSPRRSGSRIVMHDVRPATVVIYAYGLAGGLATTSYQLAGRLEFPEGWDAYDIDAIAPGACSDEDTRLMFRSLLEDRFKLRFHWETRRLTGYDLVVARNGPKLKSSKPEGKPKARNQFPGPDLGVSHMAGTDVSMEQLVGWLSARLFAQVRNLTGLTGGSYDVDVRFARGGDTAEATSDLAAAVELDLGLRLKAGKVPVKVLVVDHVERPSAN